MKLPSRLVVPLLLAIFKKKPANSSRLESVTYGFRRKCRGIGAAPTYGIMLKIRHYTKDDAHCGLAPELVTNRPSWITFLRKAVMSE